MSLKMAAKETRFWQMLSQNFKVHNLVSVQCKSIILGQITNLNMIFHVVASVYRFFKI